MVNNANKNVMLIAIIIVPCIFSSCAKKDKNQSRSHSVHQRYHVDKARSDALISIRAHDCRLIGMMGYSLYVPGSDMDLKKINRQYGIRVLKGTSDAINNKKQLHINRTAYQYATKYNKIIMRSRSCDSK